MRKYIKYSRYVNVMVKKRMKSDIMMYMRLLLPPVVKY